MAVERRDPYRSFNFRVAIGGRARAADGFSEVHLPTLLIARDLGSAGTGGEIAGEASPHLTLSRGFAGALDLYGWWDQERRSQKPRGRVVSIELLDDSRSETVATWRFTGCRPVALEYSALDALRSAVLVETIVLSFDDVEMT